MTINVTPWSSGQEANKDQIEELPAPSRIPNTNDSPAVVLSTTETTLDVKVVGQPWVNNCLCDVSEITCNIHVVELYII